MGGLEVSYPRLIFNIFRDQLKFFRGLVVIPHLKLLFHKDGGIAVGVVTVKPSGEVVGLL